MSSCVFFYSHPSILSLLDLDGEEGCLICCLHTQLHSLISLIAAVITTFVLLVFEVDLAFFFGVATFILGFIPNLGPAIATVLPLPMIILDPRPVVVRLIFTTIFLSSTQALARPPHPLWATPHAANPLPPSLPPLPPVRLRLIQFTLTQFVEPRVLGMVMNIPAVTIVVSLLFWGSVWGILGAIISASAPSPPKTTRVGG